MMMTSDKQPGCSCRLMTVSHELCGKRTQCVCRLNSYRYLKAKCMRQKKKTKRFVLHLANARFQQFFNAFKRYVQEVCEILCKKYSSKLKCKTAEQYIFSLTCKFRLSSKFCNLWCESKGSRNLETNTWLWQATKSSIIRSLFYDFFLILCFQSSWFVVRLKISLALSCSRQFSTGPGPAHAFMR